MIALTLYHAESIPISIVVALRTQTPLGVGAQIGTMMLGWSSMPWLASLDVPTLVLGAEEDPLAPPANSELIASIVPGAECHIYDEAGHLFLFDQPGPASQHISDFLDRVEAKGA